VQLRCPLGATSGHELSHTGVLVALRSPGKNLAEILASYGVTNATAGIQALGHDPLTLRAQMSWAALQREELAATTFTDNSFPYVLICNTFSTIVSLASVWIVIAQSFTPMLGA